MRGGAAFSWSAPAISSAWPRLSSMQGPAISASGRRLPKRTAPAATGGLGGTAVGAVIDTSPKPADHERRHVFGQHAGAVPGILTTETASSELIRKVAAELTGAN